MIEQNATIIKVEPYAEGHFYFVTYKVKHDEYSFNTKYLSDIGNQIRKHYLDTTTYSHILAPKLKGKKVRLVNQLGK